MNALKDGKYIEHAQQIHKDQKYGKDPYWYHLEDVSNLLYDFGFKDDVIDAAAWLHDAIEDTDLTSVDIIKTYGAKVAELVIACTGEGETRKEKQANILYKLKYCPEACVIKLADRICNVEAGIREGNTEKLEMYRKEQEDFSKVVQPNVPKEMWERLERAFSQHK